MHQNEELKDLDKVEPTVKEKEFVKCHERLRGELNNANWHFTIWKYLRNLRNDYLHELNQAPAFFGLTMDAHLLATVMRLNRFFDKQRRHLNIYEFLDFATQNLDVFSNQAFEKRMRGKETYDFVMGNHIELTPQMVEQDRQKLEQLPIYNLRKWRNKALAHIEKESVLHDIDIFKQYPVKPRQIDEIINTLHEMLNGYSHAYDASAWVKDLPLEHGIQVVVDAIRFKIGEKRKQPVMEDNRKS